MRERFPPPSGPALLALVAGTALLARSQLERGFLAAVVDGADLMFHEAGHPLLAIFGWRFLAILGGTLAQLAFPVVAAVLFARRRQTASLAVAVVWLGVNLVNVGTYAADAETRALPLLGADADGHDWWNLLGMLGIRSHARAIGGTIRLLGWSLEALGPAAAAWRWFEERLGLPSR